MLSNRILNSLDMADREEAEAVCLEAAEGRSRVLGVANLDALSSVNNVGRLLFTYDPERAKKYVLEHIESDASTEEYLQYTLACFAAREGDFNLAKLMISRHLKRYPKHRDYAIQDPDLELIDKFIKEIPAN
jgi:hypothetical protein